MNDEEEENERKDRIQISFIYSLFSFGSRLRFETNKI